MVGAGFGAVPGAIPFEVIDRYATRFRWNDGGDFEDLLAMIRAMDAEYLQSEAEESKRKGKKGKAAPQGNRRRDRK